MTTARTSLEHVTPAAGDPDRAARRYPRASRLFDKDQRPCGSAGANRDRHQQRGAVRRRDEAGSGLDGDPKGMTGSRRHRTRERPIAESELTTWTHTQASCRSRRDRSRRPGPSSPIGNTRSRWQPHEPVRRLPVGAEPQPGGGVHFRVWAPRCREVVVEIEGLDPTALQPSPMVTSRCRCRPRRPECAIASASIAVRWPCRIPPPAISPRDRTALRRSSILMALPGLTPPGAARARAARHL